MLETTFDKQTQTEQEGIYARKVSFKKPIETLKSILKENLTCELYTASLNLYYNPFNILRLFLFFFIFISYALASYTTLNLIFNYTTYGVTTTIRTVYEAPVVFPKVTFCSVNQLSSKFGFEIFKSVQNDNYSLFIQDSALSGVVKNMSKIDKQRLGHDLNDILVSCSFDYIDCNVTDFTWEYDTNYGNCYSFNSGYDSNGDKRELKYTNIEGQAFGLSLKLYMNYYENLSGLISSTGGLGAIIRIENSTQLMGYTGDGILVETGLHYRLTLSREFKSSLPKPYSNCEVDSNYVNPKLDIYNLIKQSSIGYSQKVCFLQCLQKLFIEKCNCTVPAFVSVFNVVSCFTSEQIDCTLKAYSQIYVKNNFQTNNCSSLCPLECESSKFSYTLTSFRLVGDSYVDFIKSNSNLSADFLLREITPNVAKDSFVSVKIFYDSLSYQMSSESPQMDILSLIASIGGNLGLFLSVNLFSLCEIVCTLIEIYFFKFGFKKKTKIQNETSMLSEYDKEKMNSRDIVSPSQVSQKDGIKNVY